jgi:hypothetical protein
MVFRPKEILKAVVIACQEYQLYLIFFFTGLGAAAFVLVAMLKNRRK